MEDWVAPSSGTLAGFVAIVAFVCATLVAAARFAAPEGQASNWTRRALLGLCAWLGVTGLVPYSGWLELGTPALVGFLGTCNGAAVVLAFTAFGRSVSQLPLALLIGVQAFRLPLEMILHNWGEQGTIPMSMTWDGQNLDVIAGALALVVAPIAWVLRGSAGERAFAWAFNVIGLGLLINVARVAILSSPGPQRIFGDPPLLVAFHFPTVWIVPICVAGALFTHLVTFRRLLRAQ